MPEISRYSGRRCKYLMTQYYDELFNAMKIDPDEFVPARISTREYLEIKKCVEKNLGTTLAIDGIDLRHGSEIRFDIRDTYLFDLAGTEYDTANKQYINHYAVSGYDRICEKKIMTAGHFYIYIEKRSNNEYIMYRIHSCEESKARKFHKRRWDIPEWDMFHICMKPMLKHIYFIISKVKMDFNNFLKFAYDRKDKKPY